MPDAPTVTADDTPRVVPNETTTPILPCVAVEETRDFYESLGFRTTYFQTKPYVYLAVAWSGFELHFGKAPRGMDPATEDHSGVILMVDDITPYHAAFTSAMRSTHGKVLTRGRPRITRLRPGASRFSLIDPSGNTVIVIRRDEPRELEYGGSATLTGLAKALDNARIYREFKNDSRAAFRSLKSALRRHRDEAAAVDLALTLATLIGLAVELDESAAVPRLREELAGVTLAETEREQVDALLAEVDDIRTFRG